MQGMVDYMAARTAFFDKFFLDTTTAGVRQVVISAAGLDSRGVAVALAGRHHGVQAGPAEGAGLQGVDADDNGARPTCKLASVPVDLRHDWPSALRRAPARLGCDGHCGASADGRLRPQATSGHRPRHTADAVCIGATDQKGRVTG